MERATRVRQVVAMSSGSIEDFHQGLQGRVGAWGEGGMSGLEAGGVETDGHDRCGGVGTRQRGSSHAWVRVGCPPSPYLSRG
jgi:hypothetical protein